MKKTASRGGARAIELLEPRQLLSAAAHPITLSRPPAGLHGILEVPIGSTPIAIVHTTDPSAVLPNLTAVVNWSDGSLPNQSGGPFTLDPHNPDALLVSADHIFAKAGVFQVSINIADAGQSVGTLKESVHVSEGHTIHAIAGRDFLARLGAINAVGIDATGLMINWGDGSGSAPSLAGPSRNSPTAAATTTLVSGDHVYTTPGSYHVTVQLGRQPAGSQQGIITDYVIVSPAKKHPAKLPLLTTAPPGTLPQQPGVALSLPEDLAYLTGVPSKLPAVNFDINWGDGQWENNQPATLNGGGAYINANADTKHVYAADGTYHVTGHFIDPATGKTIGQPFQQRIVVADASPGAVVLTASTGQAFTGVIGTLTMYPAPTLVGIEWGDQFHSYADVKTVGLNKFQISGSHTYYTAGNYTVNVTAAVGYDPLPSPPGVIGNFFPQTGYTGRLLTTAHVTGPVVPTVPAGVTVTPLAQSDVPDHSDFTATLATLSGYPTDANSAAAVYADISWGDPVQGFVTGSSGNVGGNDNGTVSVSIVNGQYVATATHAYQSFSEAPTTYPVTITFTRGDPSSDFGSDSLGSTTTTITVTPAITPGGVTLDLAPNVPFNGVVGTVTNASDVPNTIDWGDGSPPSPNLTVTANPDGTYTITAAHTYTQPWTYRIAAEQVYPGVVSAYGSSNQSIESLAMVSAG
ncbi:MAG TPA: hypothetical protein VFC78_22640 [Tepidisphaeraceae bacterium]|nr:hypothetical protein [Tepidisphaeraceae bacterium]